MENDGGKAGSEKTGCNSSSLVKGRENGPTNSKKKKESSSRPEQGAYWRDGKAGKKEGALRRKNGL